MLFLLSALVILVVAWLWPTRGADQQETLESQDWRIQDFKESRDDEKNDNGHFRP
jgi:hypothetical protein